MPKKKRKKKDIHLKRKLPLFYHLIIRNLFSFAILALIVALLYMTVYGYSWLWDDMINSNVTAMREHSGLTIDKKFKFKQDPDASFIYVVKEHTDDTSSILFPPKDILKNNKRKYTRLQNRAWVTYLLYPRKFTYFDELADTTKLSPFEYLLVFNYWGYHKFPYRTTREKRDALLSINF